LTANIAATTDKNLAISSVAANVENGKFYSYFVSGIYDPAATIEVLDKLSGD